MQQVIWELVRCGIQPCRVLIAFSEHPGLFSNLYFCFLFSYHLMNIYQHLLPFSMSCSGDACWLKLIMLTVKYGHIKARSRKA